MVLLAFQRQWLPDFYEKNGWVLGAIIKVMKSEAARANPAITCAAMYTTVFFEAAISGDPKRFAKVALDLWTHCFSSLAADDANKLLSIETKSLLTVLPCAKVFMNAENVQVYIPEFDWDQLGGIGGKWKHNNLLISGIWFCKH